MDFIKNVGILTSRHDVPLMVDVSERDGSIRTLFFEFRSSIPGANINLNHVRVVWNTSAAKQP